MATLSRPRQRISFRIKKETMYEFQAQHLMDLGGVVPISFEVPRHNCLYHSLVEVRPGQRCMVEQHLPNVPRQCIAVPHTVMGEFVPAEKEPLEVEGREKMIDPSHPLGHTVVVGVLRLECELQVTPGNRRRHPVLITCQA